MTADVRQTYLEAARSALELLGSPHVAERWSEPSVLPGMSVGSLAAHLARSVLQVEWFLNAPPATGPLVTAVSYYARLRDTAVPDSPLNSGVRRRSEETAAGGSAEVAHQTLQAFERLSLRLPREPSTRCVTILHHDEAMLLDEYLATRCVELTVHLEDLAFSLGVSSSAPEEAQSVTVELLFAAARRRHGDTEVLRALARRERDDQGALRVL